VRVEGRRESKQLLLRSKKRCRVEEWGGGEEGGRGRRVEFGGGERGGEVGVQNKLAMQEVGGLRII